MRSGLLPGICCCTSFATASLSSAAAAPPASAIAHSAAHDINLNFFITSLAVELVKLEPGPRRGVRSAHSSAGMMRGVHAVQTFARHMSIYLGRGQIMMAQQHLHDPQVSAVVEE